MTNIKKKIYILDGAMGTTISSYQIDKKEYDGLKYCNEILNISNPEIIKQIHREYILAGADIIETNTFNCNLLTMLDNIDDMSSNTENKIYDICKRGCDLAKSVVAEFKEKNILIAGSIGPTYLSLTNNTKTSSEKVIQENLLKKICQKQIEAIIDSNVDFILFETVFDKLNLVVQLNLCLELMKKRDKKIPIIISFVINNAGKIYSGETPQDIIQEIDCEDIIGYGFNCCNINNTLIDELIKLGKLKELENKVIICYPNAGLPDKNGSYNIIPKDLEKFYTEIFTKKLANIVGGCCGFTAKEIKNLKTLLNTTLK